MPIPQLKVRAISSGAMLPALLERAKTSGRRQRAVSTIARQPSGRTRGMFSSRPPPVMWAKPVDPCRLDQREKRTDVDSRRRRAAPRQAFVASNVPSGVSHIAHDPPDQRETVRMNARARQAKDDVTGRDGCSGQHPVAVDRSDAEAGEVVVAGRIHARHLGRLAADQRAAGLAASFGDRRDHGRCNGIVELAGRVIVEEEQGLGALDDEVVGAHRDEIDADARRGGRFRSRA